MASCRRDARLQPADVTLFLHHLRQFGVAAAVCNRGLPAPNSAERSWRHFHRHGRSPMPPLEFRRVRRVFVTHHYCGAGASRRLDAPYKYFHGSVQFEVALSVGWDQWRFAAPAHHVIHATTARPMRASEHSRGRWHRLRLGSGGFASTLPRDRCDALHRWPLRPPRRRVV